MLYAIMAARLAELEHLGGCFSLKHQIHPRLIRSQGRTFSQWQCPPISLLSTVTSGPLMLLGLVPIPQARVLRRGQSSAPSGSSFAGHRNPTHASAFFRGIPGPATFSVSPPETI